MNKPVRAAERRTDPMLINGKRYLVLHRSPNRHQRRAAKHQPQHVPPLAKVLQEMAQAARAGLATGDAT